jgi:hypothetical protein
MTGAVRLGALGALALSIVVLGACSSGGASAPAPSTLARASSTPASASSTPAPASSAAASDGPQSQAAATLVVQAWYAKGTDFCRANPPGGATPSHVVTVAPSQIPVTWSKFTVGVAGAGQAGDASTAGPGQFTATYSAGTWTITARFDFC